MKATLNDVLFPDGSDYLFSSQEQAYNTCSRTVRYPTYPPVCLNLTNPNEGILFKHGHPKVIQRVELKISFRRYGFTNMQRLFA
jgi:hypothetical protein